MPWKLIGCKTYKIIPTKKNHCAIPGRHIYFICGWYRVTIFFFPFPSDIFRFDILWHFQFNIVNTLAAELKVHPEEGLNADTSEKYNYFFPSNECLFVNNILYTLRSTEQLYLSLIFFCRAWGYGWSVLGSQGLTLCGYTDAQWPSVRPYQRVTQGLYDKCLK